MRGSRWTSASSTFTPFGRCPDRRSRSSRAASSSSARRPARASKRSPSWSSSSPPTCGSRDLVRPPGSEPGCRRGVPWLRRGIPGWSRAGCGQGRRRGNARLGARRRLCLHPDGLAVNEPGGRSDVAQPRLPPDFPATPPDDRLIGVGGRSTAGFDESGVDDHRAINAWVFRVVFRSCGRASGEPRCRLSTIVEPSPRISCFSSTRASWVRPNRPAVARNDHAAIIGPGFRWLAALRRARSVATRSRGSPGGPGWPGWPGCPRVARVARVAWGPGWPGWPG